MATLALRSRNQYTRPPETIERDVYLPQNYERDVLASTSASFLQRWLGYRSRGLVSDKEEDFTYIPALPKRIITVQARIIGRERGQPLPYTFQDEE